MLRNPNIEGDTHMVKNGMILLLLFLFIPVSAGAANIYLKDGAVIKSLFARQQGGMVYVLVNRDTDIELERGEVAISKTFKVKKTAGKIPHQKKPVKHYR
jgi:hypothetical protein